MQVKFNIYNSITTTTTTICNNNNNNNNNDNVLGARATFQCHITSRQFTCL